VNDVTERREILVVDRNPRNIALLSSFLEREGFVVCPAGSYQDLHAILCHSKSPELAVIDLSGLDRAIWEHCEQLREAGVPIIMVSPMQSAALVQQSRMHGARVVLTRPVVMQHLLGLIRSLLGG
jgi:DNA-binding response OmpR family regulator